MYSSLNSLRDLKNNLFKEIQFVNKCINNIKDLFHENFEKIIDFGKLFKRFDQKCCICTYK